MTDCKNENEANEVRECTQNEEGGEIQKCHVDVNSHVLDCFSLYVA